MPGEYPNREALSPVSRHFLRRVRLRSIRKAVNSVIAPSVNVRADVEAINRGEAERQGNYWLIHARRYGMESTGRLYPVDGEGIYTLDRGTHIALSAYNEYGETERAEQYIAANNVSEERREYARQLHRIARRI